MALQAYEWLAHPATRDLGLTPLVFDVLGLRMTRSAARRFLATLCRIHELLAPPKPITPPEAPHG
jgi:hypothetical protein